MTTSRGKYFVKIAKKQHRHNRFIQIDIDDIFVGATGSRLIADDVYALSNTQKQLRHEGIENFTFTLGFSGYYFRHGNEQEMQGDELLLGMKITAFIFI
jgi:hypothetical protein